MLRRKDSRKYVCSPADSKNKSGTPENFPGVPFFCPDIPASRPVSGVRSRLQPRPSLRFPPPASPPRKLRLSRNQGILPSSQERSTPPRSRFLRADTASAARSRPHRFPPHELPRPSCRATPSPAIGTPLHIFRLFSGKPALSTLRFPGNGSNVWAPLRLYYAGTSCLRTGNVWKRFFLPFCSWLSARFLPVSSPCGR